MLSSLEIGSAHFPSGLAFSLLSTVPFARTSQAVAQLREKISTNGKKYDVIGTLRDIFLCTFDWIAKLRQSALWCLNIDHFWRTVRYAVEV